MPASTAARGDGGRPMRPTRPHGGWRGSEYARAWKALRSAQLPTGERIRLQQELLREWAEIDLETAIEVALEEAWDRDGAGYYDPEGPLLGVFVDAFAKDPQAGWDMIRGRQFGIATGMVRHVWLNAVGNADPLFLAERLGELSWRDRDKAVAACQAGMIAANDEELSKKMFELFTKLPADVVSSEVLANVVRQRGSAADPEQLVGEIRSLSGENPRMAEALAIQMGSELSDHSVGEIRSLMSTLPEGVRDDALWSAMRFGRRGVEQLEIARMLMKEGAWDKLEQADMVRSVQDIARQSDSKAVADWANELPVRAETTELYHRSVEFYLRDHMEDSREWIASLPAGEWRDRAYAEYSQQALNSHNDSDASRWALERIGNKTFQAEAKGWRTQWETRTGWKE